MHPAPRHLPRAAAGIGLRPEIAADLLRAPGSVEFVEVVAEACFASPAARREAVALARVWPVVPHGVKLSLGSAEGIDPERAQRLGELARELGAPVVTEHVAFVRAGGREIGHLTQVPFTRAAVEVVARNVAAARRALPDVPLLLENAAWTVRWPDDEMDEPTFFHELVARTGCGLLLDVGNLYANAVNEGADPCAVLDAYPLWDVAMVHIAGGVAEDGFYLDTHAQAVPDVVFDLLARLVARVGPVPVVLERDDDFPAFGDLSDELSRARRITAATPARDAPPPRARPDIFDDVGSPAEPLARAQADLARLLTEAAPPDADATRAFGEAAIRRSREVLRRKRVDDALPLLPRLAPHRDAVKAIGQACVAASPRAASLATIADAMRIAARAAADPALSEAARADLLLLRSRFVGAGNDGSLRPRAAPFLGRERLRDGRVVWVVKGPGTTATARLFETRR